LAGTFADGTGQIVGTPFNIGDLGELTVPAGATQLQLGVNDTKFSDNTGSWQIQVSEQVPEPASFCLLALGSISLLGRRRGVRRKQ
jgi:hypothetical protein